MILVVLVLGFLVAPAAVTADPIETLSVVVQKGVLSLEATNSSLEHVLIRIGETIHARVVIETVLAEELARTRVDTSFNGVSVPAALRRLLRGRHYVVMYGPAGVDELRIYRDGTTGYRELTPPDPITRNRPTSIPLAGWPPDEPADVARLRHTALDGPDASARVEALDELSNIRDAATLLDVFARMLTHERDPGVLQRLLELAAQQPSGIPAETLRRFVTRDLDGTSRPQAVELLADRAGDDPATRALLRSLATTDVSPDVRQSAATAIHNLERPARPAPDLPSASRHMNARDTSHND